MVTYGSMKLADELDDNSIELSDSTRHPKTYQRQSDEAIGEIENGTAACPVVKERRRLTDNEMSGVIAVYAVLLLSVSLVLFGDWFAGNVDSEFIFGEEYTLCLTIVSLAWMCFVPLKTFWRRGRGRSNSEGNELPEGLRQSLLVKPLSLFATVSVILTIGQIVDAGILVGDCLTPVAIPCGIMKLLYIPVQVCFIICSRKRVTFRKNLLNGLMVIQIIVTNIILYMWTFIKSKEDFVPLNEPGALCLTVLTTAIHPTTSPNVTTTSPNGTITSPNGTNISSSLRHCNHTIHDKLFPWFYPFCLEFCLTASAMLAEQWVESSPLTTTDSDPDEEVPTTEDGPSPPLEVETKKISVSVAMILGIFAIVAHFGIIAYLVVETDLVVATVLWYTTEGVTGLTILTASIIGLISNMTIKIQQRKHLQWTNHWFLLELLAL